MRASKALTAHDQKMDLYCQPFMVLALDKETKAMVTEFNTHTQKFQSRAHKKLQLFYHLLIIIITQI